MKSVIIQLGDTEYVVDYTFDAGENHSVVLDEDQTPFGFKYIDGKLSHSTPAAGYGVNLINDVMQRIYDIERAKTKYTDGLWFYCYIRRIKGASDDKARRDTADNLRRNSRSFATRRSLQFSAKVKKRGY